jgi:hypothetical protein
VDTSAYEQYEKQEGDYVEAEAIPEVEAAAVDETVPGAEGEDTTKR